jgi:hypothetical protein
MIRTVITIVLCSFVFYPLFSQKKELKTKFGKISDAEIAMKAAPIDPEAPGVVLFDKGTVSHFYSASIGFSIEYVRHVRTKIFKKEAYDAATVAFLYNPDHGRISDLKAVCYNVEDGKVTEIELEKANIFDEKITKSRMQRKFTIPGVREGSIIEYKYKITLQGSVSLPVDHWTFQNSTMPVMWSEFESSIPTFIEFKKIAQGWIPFSVAEDEVRSQTLTDGDNDRIEYDTKHMHFIQENIPALKTEPYSGSPNDYCSRIFFEVSAVYTTKLMPAGDRYRLVNMSLKEYNNTWARLGKDLLEDIYNDALKSSKYTEETTAGLVAGKTTPAEKTAAIYEYIRKNYVAEDRSTVWLSRSMEKVTKEHKGTPAEMNILFVNMLRKAGINAWPLLISTREHGRIHPVRISPDAFDRLIVAADLGEKNLTLMDASAALLPLGLLPLEDLNSDGLLLKSETEVEWIPLQNNVPNRLAVVGDFVIQPEGGLKGTVNRSASGYDALKDRSHVREKDAAHAANQCFSAWAADGKFSDVKVNGAEQWHEPIVKIDLTLENTSLVSASGNKLYFNPTLGLGLHENPFKNPERKFNIDFGAPSDETYMLTFKIPAGYKVEEAPKSAKMIFGENALIFDYRVDNQPEQIKVIVKSRVKSTYHGIDKYEDLRQFYTAMLAKMEEQIVLTKL